MQLLSFYMLKVVTCSGLLMLYYRLALRNKRFNYYNRFYLLFAVAASVLLPLLQLNLFTVKSSNVGAMAFINVMNTPDASVNLSTKNGLAFSFVNWPATSGMAYAFASILLLVILLARIIKIYSIKKKYGHSNMAAFDYMNTDLPQAPFSFLRNLFWRNDIDMNEAAGRQILKHELTHIQQRHTWDKLYMQVVTAVLWVNPFFWLTQRELYMLHEFIADEKAVENNDGAAFATMLITAQYRKSGFFPASQFFSSPIKRRLFMLTNLTKPSYGYLRRLMLLPLLATVTMLFAFRLQKAGSVENPAAQQHSAAASTGDTINPAPLYELSGKNVLRAAVDSIDANDIASIVVLKDSAAATKYGDQGTNSVVEVTTKDPNAGTATENGTDSANIRKNKLLATKAGDKNATGVIAPSVKNNTTENTKPTTTLSDSTNDAEKKEVGVIAKKQGPLYVLDGKIISEVEFNIIDPNRIASVRVLKGKTATDIYGEKGGNGVVEITTKNTQIFKPAPIGFQPGRKVL